MHFLGNKVKFHDLKLSKRPLMHCRCYAQLFAGHAAARASLRFHILTNNLRSYVVIHRPVTGPKNSEFHDSVPHLIDMWSKNWLRVPHNKNYILLKIL